MEERESVCVCVQRMQSVCVSCPTCSGENNAARSGSSARSRTLLTHLSVTMSRTAPNLELCPSALAACPSTASRRLDMP